MGIHCLFPIVTNGNKQRRGTLNGPYSIEAMFLNRTHPRSVPGKRPCTSFQGVTVAASIRMYGNYILGKVSAHAGQIATYV